MVPTRLLLESFIEALAEEDGPPVPGPATHYGFDPDPADYDSASGTTITMFALDATDQIDITYTNTPDNFPSGVANAPIFNGWLDGVATVDLSATGSGGYAIFFSDPFDGGINGTLTGTCT